MNRTLRQSGVTLVEVVVATTLVAVVLVASLETLGGSMRTMRATTAEVDAHTLAERMMAEVIGLPYEDPDGNGSGLGIESDEPTPPTDRLAFDDVDDYENLSRSPPEARDGTPLADYTGWTQAWRVRYADSEANGSGVVAPIANDEGLLRIAVEVTSPSGEVTELYAFRSRLGPADAPAPFDAERVTAVQATIAIGGTDAVMRSANPTNLAEVP